MVPCGLTAIGDIAEADTFTAEAIGQGQGPGVLMYAEDGCIPTVATHGTEGVGDRRPPNPLKGEFKSKRLRGDNP
jgi:hypothetical protein